MVWRSFIFFYKVIFVTDVFHGCWVISFFKVKNSLLTRFKVLVFGERVEDCGLLPVCNLKSA